MAFINQPKKKKKKKLQKEEELTVRVGVREIDLKKEKKKKNPSFDDLELYRESSEKRNKKPYIIDKENQKAKF